MGDSDPAGSFGAGTRDIEALLTTEEEILMARDTSDVHAVGAAEPTEPPGAKGPLLPGHVGPSPPEIAKLAPPSSLAPEHRPSFRRRMTTTDVHRAVNSDERCELCHEPGHTTKRCRFYVEKERDSAFKGSRRTRAVSSFVSESMRRRDFPNDDVRQLRCFYCGETGHWKRDCPENPDRPGTPKEDTSTAGVWTSKVAHDPNRLTDIRSDAGKFNKPLPANVDITIPGISKAWEWFQRVDADESGRLDQDEVKELSRQLGFEWSKSELARNYEAMTTVNGYYTRGATIDSRSHKEPSNGKGASFHDFAAWWARHAALERRIMRRTVKDFFEKLDPERSGVLGFESFKRLVARIENQEDLPDLSDSEPVDVEMEWNTIQKVQFSHHHKTHPGMVGITFDAFESWWMDRVGIRESDLPVLPEYLVNQAERKVAAIQLAQARQQRVPLWSVKMRVWENMQHKLCQLVRMQIQWGSLWEIYETRTHSEFHLDEIPPFIRDPDSFSSAAWDLISVLFLLYVTAAVPVRACFGLDDELWSATFWFEVIVDLFFAVDILVNFRTAFWDSNGFREKDTKKIAEHYIEHWFVLDLLSCVPVGYIQYFINAEDEASGEFRAVKALRLLKMTKMLRLSRVKRILARHGSEVNYHQYFSIASTIFTIVLAVHLITCIFYLLGDAAEQIVNQESGSVISNIDGWVAREKDWWSNVSLPTSGGHKTPDPSVGVSTRYTTSMYYVLNSLSRGFTTAEKVFGVLADFTRDIILGLVASLMTTITMSMASDDNTVAMKLQKLKRWMRERHLPKGFQQNAMEYFNEVWSSQQIKVEDLVTQCPPAMASSMMHLLYGRVISTVPPFRGLSTEVIGALCMRCKSLLALKDQTVIRQGEPGQEMYIVMDGELEVTVRDERSNPEAELQNQKRLGFLSAGAFFGEAPVIAERDDTSLLLRTRTVTAVTNSELCYLTRDAIAELCIDFPELRARINRFRNSASVLNNSRLKKINMTREELQASVATYRANLRKTERIREKMNLDENAYVPAALLPTENPMLIARAQMRFRRGSVTALERVSRRQPSSELNVDANLDTSRESATHLDTGSGVGMDTNKSGKNDAFLSSDDASGLMAVRQMLLEQRRWMSQSIAELQREQREHLVAMEKKLDAFGSSIAAFQ